MDSMCPQCKKQTHLILDHSTGDTICKECGLVQESHYIQDIAEWRTFDDSDNDPTRVGNASNPLLTNGGLSTVISKRNTSERDSSGFAKYQNCVPDPDRALLSAFSRIETIADRLDLVRTIKDRANEIYKTVVDDLSKKGRDQNATAAACIYVACKQEPNPRTIKDIRDASNVPQKDIGKLSKFILNLLKLKGTALTPNGSVTTAADFVKSFGIKLGMNTKATRAATEVATTVVNNLDIRRSSPSIAAAVIYMISMLENPFHLKDIARASDTTEVTIKATYNELQRHAKTIVPGWFCKPEDLIKLPSRAR